MAEYLDRAGLAYFWGKTKEYVNENSPIEFVENLDSSNKVPLRSLASGTYVLKGYFTSYTGGTHSYTFSTGMLVAVLQQSAMSYVQIFHPKSNTIQYLEITDDSVTRQDAKLINMESVANMVTGIDEYSDDSHYPSAKAVYTHTQESLPTKVSELENDKGYITGYTEIDPTVPSWAKESTKPTYTKSEVGLGNVDDVKQYSEDNPPPYPVTSVNGKTSAVSLGASDVGADASGTASSAVSTHNSSSSAHSSLFNAKVSKSGGTMEGALTAQANTNYTTRQVRNVFEIADGETFPTGLNGDICFVYSQ